MISVIMSVYNAEEYVSQCVSSILDQSFDDFEFFVIDDGSSDHSLDILRSFDDKRLDVISQPNRGLTATLNTLIRRCRGKYVARQDADDYSFLDRLQQQFEYLEANPDIALLGTGSVQVDHANSPIHNFVPETRPITLSQQLVEVNPFTHGSWMVRKTILDEFDGYREEFKYSQDYDLLLRVNEKYQLSNLPEVLYAHRHSKDMVSVVNVEGQGYFAELARQCWRERADFGEDCIQKGNYTSEQHPQAHHSTDGIVMYHKHLISAWARKGEAKKVRREIAALLKVSPREPFAWIQYMISLGGNRFLRKITNMWEGLRKE